MRAFCWILLFAFLFAIVPSDIAAAQLSVSPSSTAVAPGQTIQFSARVSGPSSVPTWSVNGMRGGSDDVGTISNDGLYRAPASVSAPMVVTVTATATQTKSRSLVTDPLAGSATVNVNSVVTVSVDPPAATMLPAQTQYFSATVQGAANKGVKWSIDPPTGSISSSGAYTVPEAIPSKRSVTVTATSEADPTKSASAGVVLLPALTISTAALPGGTTGTPYSAAIAATGGVVPYTWSIAAGALPPGLSLSAASGAISGAPTAAGSYNVFVNVTDSAGYKAGATFVLAIAAATCAGCPVGLTITTASLPAGMVGSPYSAVLNAAGGVPPYSWSITSGQLPAGITLDTQSGKISGTPVSAGSSSLTTAVTDSAPTQATSTRLFTVSTSPDSGRDAYGGRADIKCTAGAKTRFYTEKVNSRWWLCTPAGNVLWAQGTHVTWPQGNYAEKYGSVDNAMEQTIARLRSWGFNFLHAYSSAYLQPWRRTSKMPTVWVLRPAAYGLYASSSPNSPYPPGLLDQNIKDLGNGISPYFTSVSGAGMPDWGDLGRISAGLKWMLTQSQQQDPAGIAPAIDSNNSLDYVIGIAVEDSDNTWGYFTSGQNDPFDTQPSRKGGSHGGYMTAVMSPKQQASARWDAVYPNDTVYAKKAWHDYLVRKYSTIASLNAAWGSNYTTFDSSSTAVTGEAIGKTDGSSATYSHTVSHSGMLTPNSIRVYQDGVLIAGDCFHPNWGDVCNPTKGAVWGTIYGPTASGGTVNYQTKAITVNYTGIFKYLNSISCTPGPGGSCTATVAGYDDGPLGLSVGDTVTIRGSSCCSVTSETVVSKTGPSSGLYTYSWTNNAGKSGSESWSSGARVQAARLKVPTSGHVLTVDYEVNGWGAGGTGVMDEDGRPSHAWIGADSFALTDANLVVANDLREFLYELTHAYFGSIRDSIRAAFASHGLDAPMYLGPDSLGTWTSTPRKEVLQAASDTVDLAIFGGAAGYTLTQPMLEFISKWYGRPFIDGVYLHANADSPFSSNRVESDYATQEARGAAYVATVKAYLSTAASGGRVGFGWWEYADNASEGTNWGLVTLNDNAYDGYESGTARGRCAPPLEAYNCGGETRNFGNVITSVKEANDIWRTQ